MVSNGTRVSKLCSHAQYLNLNIENPVVAYYLRLFKHQLVRPNYTQKLYIVTKV